MKFNTGFPPTNNVGAYTGTALVYMLWCNFVLGANFILLCLKFIIIHYHTLKTKENKVCTKDKIAPQHIQVTPSPSPIKIWVLTVGLLFSAPNKQVLTISWLHCILFHRLCLSISDFHPDTWNPAWSVSTILTGLLSFMVCCSCR